MWIIATLGAAEDDVVWAYAQKNGFSIVSKDSDFAERSVLDRSSPKIVWLRIGNCSTSEVEALLRSAYEIIRTFIEDDDESCSFCEGRTNLNADAEEISAPGVDLRRS